MQQRVHFPSQPTALADRVLVRQTLEGDQARLRPWCAATTYRSSVSFVAIWVTTIRPGGGTLTPGIPGRPGSFARRNGGAA